MKIIVVAIVAVLVAGCAAQEDPTANATSATQGAQAAPTETQDAQAPTGSIEVTVVTTELAPVPGASVVLQNTDHALFTGEDGVALFAALDPGPYTVIAAKPGYHGAGLDKGRIVDVLAGEVSTVRFTMDAVELVQAGQSYHSSFPFRGLLSCSYSIGGQSSSSVCGRGLTISGTHIGDPNDNSTHDFPVDNHLVRAFILEAKWQSSIEATGTHLFISLSPAVSCNVYNYCAPDGQMGGAGGASPIRYEYPPHDSTVDARSRLGMNPEDYPRTAYASVHSRCTAPCVVSVTINQSYDAYATVFYGEKPPRDWSIFTEA